MKGIILAGGYGTRLRPTTLAVSKQLLPVFDKPLIYYPLSTLLFAGVDEALIITSPEAGEPMKRLLGNGENFGISISYATQASPGGIPEALLIAKSFLNGEGCVLTLGDNILYGPAVGTNLAEQVGGGNGAKIFAYGTEDLRRFGAVVFDSEGRVVELEEKPLSTSAKHAVVGMYFLDGTASERAEKLEKSSRGELEIIDLLKMYLEDGTLFSIRLPLSTVWFDAGTSHSLQDAANFVRITHDVRGISIGSPHEVAFRLGRISRESLKEVADSMRGSDYGTYLAKIAHMEEGSN